MEAVNLSPREIVSELDRSIVGPKDAKRAGAIGLSDVDLGLCLALGLVISISDELAADYRAGGDDLADLMGGSGRLLPIPATFLLDAAGVVRFAFVDPDFRNRAEPADVLAAMVPDSVVG